MSRPDQPVRIKHPTTGDHYTTTRLVAEQNGYRIIEGRPATDRYGRWLPPKRRVHLGVRITTQGIPPDDTNTEE